MEDKNKEVQLTDEEIEDVSGGFIWNLGPDVGQASTPKEVGTEEIMRTACSARCTGKR